jgi:hypothetical protein
MNKRVNIAKRQPLRNRPSSPKKIDWNVIVVEEFSQAFGPPQTELSRLGPMLNLQGKWRPDLRGKTEPA